MHFNQYSDCLYDIGVLNFNQPIRGKNNVSNDLNYFMGNGGVGMKTDRQHNERNPEWDTTCGSWGELALWFLIIGQAIFVGLLFLFIGGE